jgi:hypothetical protein
MEITVLMLFVWTHFVADFVLQTHKMATNKSTSNAWLTSHVATYTGVFVLVSLLSPAITVMYAIVNGVLHFATDYFTSRITSRLYKEGRIHDFFVVIGFDQALHMSAMILTYYWMFM